MDRDELAELAGVLARVWDEGYDQGNSDGRWNDMTANPYPTQEGHEA